MDAGSRARLVRSGACRSRAAAVAEGHHWWPSPRLSRVDAEGDCVLLRRIFVAILAPLIFASLANASHDPRTTITVFVPGFDPGGASHQGVFGDDVADPLLEDIAGLVGLPT